MAIIETKNLTFSYMINPNKKILDNVNLTVEQGEYVVICGKSGSGKTTLLRHLKTAVTPHGKRSGEILFMGKKIEETDTRTQAESIGYVMQNPDSQIVTDKVWHELAFGLESLGCEQQTMRIRVAEMASYFGIQSWFDRNVSELSGGQKQLLNLASIMAMRPELIILDEPTSQLDPIAASDFLNTIRQINRDLGTTVIITEHRLEDVLISADKVVVMEQGSCIMNGTPKEVGRKLYEGKSDLFKLMPSPMQIYYAVDGSNEPVLTVREGRKWLNNYIDKKTPMTHAMEEKSNNKNAVTVKEVWFKYDKKYGDVLRDFSVEIPDNVIYALVGGNGTGKSTALKTIAGICKPYRGKIKTNGKVSMLVQDPVSVFAKKTVREELEEMVANEADRDKQVADIAKLCEIDNLMSMHPYDLSGGEQQRVALAKVMLSKPDILLLDEPTKGMDNLFKIQFAGFLNSLKDKGITIVIVSHDVEFCAKYADYVGMFFGGAVIGSNSTREFFAENSFYTTAAGRMSRDIDRFAVTNEDVIQLCGRE